MGYDATAKACNGEAGIRTQGTRRHTAFPVLPDQPLWHLSELHLLPLYHYSPSPQGRPEFKTTSPRITRKKQSQSPRAPRTPRAPSKGQRFQDGRTKEHTETGFSGLICFSPAFLSVSLGALGVLGALGDFRCCFFVVRDKLVLFELPLRNLPDPV